MVYSCEDLGHFVCVDYDTTGASMYGWEIVNMIILVMERLHPILLPTFLSRYRLFDTARRNVPTRPRCFLVGVPCPDLKVVE